MEKSNYYTTNEEKEQMLRQGSFDKLDIPESFMGNFKDLFELLLITFGAVAIGLNRYVVCLHDCHFAYCLVIVMIIVFMNVDAPKMVRIT